MLDVSKEHYDGTNPGTLLIASHDDLSASANGRGAAAQEKTLSTNCHWPKLRNGGHWLFGAHEPFSEKRALQIIQHYGMDESCHAGEFHFMLVNGEAPTGKMDFEDCVDHHAGVFRMWQYPKGDRDAGKWVLTHGRESVIGPFDDGEAASVMAVIKRYGLTRYCFGFHRPGKGFEYWKAD